MTTDELENYTPKGQLTGFPKEIIAKMLDCQENQGYPRDVSVFEKKIYAGMDQKGFGWKRTKDGLAFWEQVILQRDFNLFFKKYPKKEEIKVCSKCQKEVKSAQSSVEIENNTTEEDSQLFRVGDKVYDIMLGEVGIVKNIILNNVSAFPIEVYYESCGIVLYALEGKYLSNDKYPRLLHYRDDYDYSVIDFNNFPRRQEYKKWRAEVGGIYYFIKRDEHDFNLDKIYRSLDYYNSFSNELYKIGNYFQTREQAQEIVDQTNTYFQKIVKI